MRAEPQNRGRFTDYVPTTLLGNRYSRVSWEIFYESSAEMTEPYRRHFYNPDDVNLRRRLTIVFRNRRCLAEVKASLS